MLPHNLRRVAFRSCLAIGLVSFSVPSFAQQESGVSINLVRNQVPAKSASFRSNAPRVTALEQVPDEHPVQAAVAPVGTEQDGVSHGQRPPIVVPALPTPNLDLTDIGTGKLPDDLVAGRLPPMQVLPYGPDRNYGFSSYEKTWTAPVFCHQPLYYEDTMLERHGHERFPMLTPMLSGVRFYTGILTTPYLATLRRPLVEYPNTGHYRPGSAAPALRERAPYDKTALRLQLLTTGAVIVGATH